MVLSKARPNDCWVPRAARRHALSTELLAFGEVVRSRRVELGLSQEALAHNAKIDRSYVSSIERGKQNVGLMLAMQIANALGLSLSDLASAARL